MASLQDQTRGRATRAARGYVLGRILERARIPIGALLAAFLVFMGVQKFGGENAVFQYMAAQSGIGLFEPGVRILTGVLEFLAAGLIVGSFFVKPLRGLGGLLALGVIGGAVVFHLTPWLGINAPVAFDEAGDYVRSPFLFVMAVVFTVISLIYLCTEKSALGRFLRRG